MLRPLELFIGLRYTRAKRRNHFISFISFMSMLGIFLSLTVLITVLSVMNGFGEELRTRILGVISHVTITQGNNRLSDWQGLLEQVQDHEHVLGSAPYVMGQGLLTRGKGVSGAMVRGVVPQRETQVSVLHNKMVEGDLEALESGAFHIILGSSLANRLGATLGSQVTVLVPQALVTPAGILPTFKRFTVVGMFDVGMDEYDGGLALIHLEDAARLYRLGNQVSGVRLKLDDMFQARGVATSLADKLGPSYWAVDWTRQHANWFRAIKIEKRMMTIILLFIVAIAAFNIVSTLIMVVTDKQADIAILRTLGLSPASVMGVFMVQGSVIGIVGTLFGAIGGVVLAFNIETIVHTIERWFNTSFLADDVYYITDLPGQVHTNDVLVVTAISLAMSMLATLYPAWRAARVQPAEALRYE